MEAKEKAQELMNEFKHYIYPFAAGSGYLTGDIDEDVIKNNSRHCASIAVEEILKLVDSDIENCAVHRSNFKRKAYWQEVKEELKKL